jgi:signal transduction histidine kinase
VLPYRNAADRVDGVVITFIDVTERKRDEEALRKSEEFHRFAVEAGRIGTWELNLVADEYVISPQMAALMDFAPSRRRVNQARWLEAVMPEDLPRVTEALAVATTRNAPFEAEFRVRVRNGVERWLYSRGAVKRDGTGSPLRVQGASIEVTEHRRAQETLRLAKEAAERASNMKSQFMSTMSHELRTPLTAVIGLADVLGNEVVGTMNEKQKDYLARIHTSAWHLVGIIDEILTFTRSEAGKESIRIAEVDAAEIVRGVTEMVRTEADASGLEFITEGVDKPVIALTDGGKLRQIVVNLIGNAIKYTDSGRVTVVLGSSEDSFSISVSDTGPGVPQERLNDIFEPFVQLDGSSTREHGGTGLGLTICRRLARMLGGDVEVQSSEGAGSTFTLNLPRRSNLPAAGNGAPTGRQVATTTTRAEKFE